MERYRYWSILLCGIRRPHRNMSHLQARMIPDPPAQHDPGRGNCGLRISDCGMGIAESGEPEGDSSRGVGMTGGEGPPRSGSRQTLLSLQPPKFWRVRLPTFVSFGCFVYFVVNSPAKNSHRRQQRQQSLFHFPPLCSLCSLMQKKLIHKR